MPKSAQLLRSIILEGNIEKFFEIIPEITLNARDEEGNTFLHLTHLAKKNALYMANELLERDLTILHSHNQNQQTPLHSAVSGGNFPLVRLFLAYGADRNAKDINDKTPAEIAYSMQRFDILHSLQADQVNYENDELQLLNDIQNLTEPPSLIVEVLNRIRSWRECFSTEYHHFLQTLEESLVDRSLFLQKEKKSEESVEQSTSSEKKKSKSVAKLVKSLTGKPKEQQPEVKEERKEEESNLNHQLEKLINILTQLKVEAESQSKLGEEDLKPDFELIARKCNELLVYYQSPPVTTISAPSSKLRIYNGNRGYRELLQFVAERFTYHFDRVGIRYKSNDRGCHTVVKIGGIHCKVWPSAPAVENAVYALFHIFSHQAAAPTELLVITKPHVQGEDSPRKTAVPVLASKSVEGMLFQELLEKHPEKVQKIDPYNFGLQYIVLGILAKSVDGKAENYIAREVLDSQGQLIYIEIVGFDNDEAFSDPICLGKGQRKQHVLMLKNIFFCLPQRKEPIDLVLRKQLLAEDPALMVIRWLNLLQGYNKRYKGFEQGDLHIREALKEIGIPLCLKPKMAIELYELLVKIRAELRANVMLTHEDLLKACYPLVRRFYDDICEEAAKKAKQPNDYYSQIGDLIFHGKDVEELKLTESERQSLKNMTSSSQDYVDKRTQPISEALQEFISSLDFSEIPASVQQKILNELVNGFPEIKKLTLRGCSVLKDAWFVKAAEGFTHLQRLTLINCSGINMQAIEGWLKRFPNLNITLQGYQEFEAHELFKIFEYCRDFYLVLPDAKQSKHKVELRNFALLKLASALNDTVLVTFLLLAGFHLTQTNQYSSPLREAIERKDPPLVKMLIDYGSNVNEYVEVLRDEPDGNKRKESISLLDRAWEIGDLPQGETERLNMLSILQSLLAAGAIESKVPKNKKGRDVLDLGLQFRKMFPHLIEEKILRNFTIIHNLLKSENIPVVISSKTKRLDLSSKTELGGCQVTPELLKKILEHTKGNLQTLNLSGCKVDDLEQVLKDCASFGVKKVILDFSQVLNINLARNHALKSELNNVGLQIEVDTVRLNGKDVTEDNFKLMINMLSLKEMNAVKELEITNCTLTQTQMMELNVAIKKFTTLRSITLNNLKVDKSELANLMLALREHSSLEKVSLQNNKISENDQVCIQALSQLLYNHSSLKSLSLYRNPIGDKGVGILKKPLRSHRSLETLDLNEIGLTDAGFFDLQVDGVASSLTSLDIRYNKLTKESAEKLKGFASLNPSIFDLRCESSNDDLNNAIKLELPRVLLRNQQQFQKKQLLNSYRSRTEKSSLSSPKNNKKTDFIVFMQEVMGSSAVGIFKAHQQAVDELPEKIKLPAQWIKRTQQTLEAELKGSEQEKFYSLNDFAQSDQLKKNLSDIESRQFVNMQRNVDILAQRSTMNSGLKEDKCLWKFYSILQLKLEAAFFGTKFLSTQILCPKPWEQINRNDVLGVSIDLLTSQVSLVPFLHPLNISTNTTAKREEEVKREEDAKLKAQASYFSKLPFELTSLLRITHAIANKLTLQFSEQIKKMPVFPEQPLTTLIYKSQTTVIVKPLELKSVEAFADVVVLRILAALLTQKLNFKELAEECIAYGSGAKCVKQAVGEENPLASLNLPVICHDVLENLEKEYPFVSGSDQTGFYQSVLSSAPVSTAHTTSNTATVTTTTATTTTTTANVRNNDETEVAKLTF